MTTTNIYEPDDAYIAARDALMPDAEKLAWNEVRARCGETSSEKAQLLWSKLFHLWMDRLVAVEIHGRGWPR